MSTGFITTERVYVSYKLLANVEDLLHAVDAGVGKAASAQRVVHDVLDVGGEARSRKPFGVSADTRADLDAFVEAIDTLLDDRGADANNDEQTVELIRRTIAEAVAELKGEPEQQYLRRVNAIFEAREGI